MEILRPLHAWAWGDSQAWALEVIEILKENDISIPGIREFRNKIDAGPLSCEDIDWLQNTANELLDPHGVWLHPRHGLVCD